jgi:hypothetical protein
MVRLQRGACEADRRENADRPIWTDFGTFEEPTPLSPEESAYQDFLFALPEDVLCELQALYWLGCERPPGSRIKRRLKCWLEYSNSNDDHMVSYLYGKNLHLAEALQRSLEMLGWSEESTSIDTDERAATVNTTRGNSGSSRRTRS